MSQYNFNKILTKKRIFFSVSIEVQDERVSLNGLLLKEEKGGEFGFEKIISNLPLENFLAENNNIPVLFNLSGKGVTTRLMDKQKGYLKKILFNADVEDFYTYEKHFNDQVLISFCRKKTVDEYVEIIKKAGFFIVFVTIGPVSLIDLLPLVKGSSLGTRSFLIQRNEEGLINFTAQQGEKSYYLVSGECLTLDSTLGLANYYNFKNGDEGVKELNELVKEDKKELKYRKLLFLLLPVIVFTLLTLTMFGHFSKKSLYENLQKGEALATQIENQNKFREKLTSDLRQKEKVLENSGFKSPGFFTQTISSITNMVPQEIFLEKFEVQPMPGKISSENPINIQPNSVIIEGFSSDESQFKMWIQDIEEISNVKRLEVIDYSRETETISKFILEISIF